MTNATATAATPADCTVVELAAVQFAWPGQARMLLDIPHARIARGETVFLGGPSGSGKSTLLSLLGGVLVASSGSVRIMDQDLGALSARRRDRFRADRIGFIFQMFNLVPYLGIVDNVVLPTRFSTSRRQRAVDRSGSVEAEARRLLAALDLDIATLEGNNAAALSLGQQQRVAAARALLGAPSLIIADEPTSALDETTRERFLELLFAECSAAETTVVLVSHDRRLGRLFDRQLELADLNRAATTDAP